MKNSVILLSTLIIVLIISTGCWHRNIEDVEPERQEVFRGEATTRLNIRRGAGQNAAIITTVQPGTCVEVHEISENGKWAHIQLADGRTGYASTEYLRISKVENIPDDELFAPQGLGEINKKNVFCALCRVKLCIWQKNRG